MAEKRSMAGSLVPTVGSARFRPVPAPGLALSRLYARSQDAIFLVPALALLGLFLLWPLLWVIGMSFTSWDGLGPIHWAGFSTWAGLFQDSTFRAALRNTVTWTLLSATIPVITGFVLAILLSRARAGIGPLGRALAILPLLLPLSVTAVTFKIIYNPNIGPLNHLLSDVNLPAQDWLGDPKLSLWSLFVIMLWVSAGFSVLVFTGAIRSIDRAYFDLARVEGAGALIRLKDVIFPACRKTAALSVVVTVVITSATFDLLYVVTTASNSTIMLPLDMYNRALGGSNVGAGAAEATIEILIGLLLAGAVLLISGTHPSMSGEAQKEARPGGWWPTVFAALACVVLALPLLSDLSSALLHGAQIISPPLFPWPPTGSAFATAWNTGGLGNALATSGLVALATVILTVGVSLPAAYALCDRRLSIWVRRSLLGLLVFSLLLPGEPYLIPLGYLVQQLGMWDMAGVVLAEAAREIPISVLLLWIFINGLPSDTLAAAEIEAGRGLRMLSQVVTPLTAPIGVAVAVWVFVTSWSETTLPNILLTGSTAQTAPVALSAFAGRADTQINLLGAGALLLVLPVLMVLLLAYGPASRGLRLAGRALTA